MKKTKIITSLGPSSYNEKTFTEMVKNGANVARINFSHVTPEEKKLDLDAIHAARKNTGCPIAILYDTKGPEFRNGVFEGDEVVLEEGKTIRIVKDEVIGNKERFSVNHPSAISSLKVGTEVFLLNGLMKLVVTSVEDDGVTCKIVNGGVLGNKKSMSVPGIQLNIPFISEADREDIIYACEHEGDYLALSFVGSREDVLEARKILKDHNREDMKIIAKIESLTGINNLDSILEVSDGVMVARGDLGAEVPMSMLPVYQKEIIKCARKHGKIAVVATEMLESMMKNSRPTRAEVSDVSAAVYDGADAVMLSGETTMGDHPVEVVKYMAEICETAEQFYDYDKKFEHDKISGVSELVAQGVVECAKAEDVKVIVAHSISGNTARRISNLKPTCPILATCDNEELARGLCLNYGVYSSIVKYTDDMDEIVAASKKAACEKFDLKEKDEVIITAGLNNKEKPVTNFMKIEEI